MPFKSAQSFSFYSMVSSTKQSRLLEVVAVDNKSSALWSSHIYELKDDKSVLLNSLPENAVTAFTESETAHAIRGRESLKLAPRSTQLVGLISEDMASGFAFRELCSKGLYKYKWSLKPRDY